MDYYSPAPLLVQQWKNVSGNFFFRRFSSGLGGGISSGLRGSFSSGFFGGSFFGGGYFGLFEHCLLYALELELP